MRSRLALLSSLLFLAAASSHAETNAAQAATPATEDTKLSSQLRVYVREFRFKGNTVFTDKQLAALVAQYVGREITSEDLEEGRRSITLFYVSAGFENQ